jgi:hypothetical protein
LDFVQEIGVRILLLILLLVAAGAGFVLFGDRLGLRENAVVERVEEKIKSAAETALVRGIEKPQCAKLLKHIQDKTGAAVERVSPAGHEVLLTHAGTKSTISLDCTTPARMSLTFISKDTAPSPDWFRTIGDASAALVNAAPEAIVAEAKKCLADARRDASTSAGEEESGIDVDCALPEKDERGYLVAVMAADPAAGPAAAPVEKPQTTEKPKPAPAPAPAKRRHK